MDFKKFQVSFFEIIGTRLPPHSKLAPTIADLLDVSLNTAYRKIRAEVALNIEEIMLLAREFNLSIDRILDAETGDKINFVFRRDVTNLQDIEAYFINTRAELQQLRKDPNACLYYAARDLPLFYYFRYPDLAAFKIGVWLKDYNQLNTEDARLYFLPEVLGEQLLAKAKALGEEYFLVQTEEIWTRHVLDNTLAQLDYCHSVGLINQNRIESILGDLKRVMEDKIESTSRNAKGDGTFSAALYQTDFLTLNNGAFVTSSVGQTTFLAYSGINFLETTNQAFCADFKLSFELHKKSGILLSGSAEKQRTAFFKDLYRQMDRLMPGLQETA